MNFTRAGLEDAGFEGFVTFEQHASWSSRPKFSGVYVVLREPAEPPRFLPVSPAGSKPAASATVPVAALSEAWVDGATVVYIGKAAGKKGLHDRLRQFRRHGEGHNPSHWGGRYLWQLDDAARLVLCWRETAKGDARSEERAMIEDFVQQHGQRPFANIVD